MGSMRVNHNAGANQEIIANGLAAEEGFGFESKDNGGRGGIRALNHNFRFQFMRFPSVFKRIVSLFDLTDLCRLLTLLLTAKTELKI
jgi:hypothetical protein